MIFTLCLVRRYVWLCQLGHNQFICNVHLSVCFLKWLNNFNQNQIIFPLLPLLHLSSLLSHTPSSLPPQPQSPFSPHIFSLLTPAVLLFPSPHQLSSPSPHPSLFLPQVMLALGGWSFGSKPFQDLTSNQYRMNGFVYDSLEFLRKHEFDGLDIDWEVRGAGRQGGSLGETGQYISERNIGEMKYWVLTLTV